MRFINHTFRYITDRFIFIIDRFIIYLQIDDEIYIYYIFTDER